MKLGEHKASQGRGEQRGSPWYETNEGFRRFVQNVADHAIFAIDPKGCVLTWNDGAKRITSYQADEVLGEHLSRLYPFDPSRRNKIDQQLQIAASENRFEDEDWSVCKDGSQFWAHHFVTALRDDSGVLLGFLVVIRDISKRKRLEEALRESEERFRSLSASSPLGIFLADTEGQCSYANPRCRAIWGFSLVESLGESWLQSVHPEDRETVMREWSASVREQREFSREFRIRTRQGNVRWVQQRCALMFSDSGKLLGRVGTVEDISPRKQAELERNALFEQVEAARDRLQLLSRRLVEVQESERRRIARELHDEIGQELTALRISLQMGARMPGEQIQETLHNAQARVGDLLSRVRELSLELRPAMLDDLGLLPALLWHFDRYASQTGIRVEFAHHGLEWRRFPPEMETAAYRIVQEALTNVARHAHVNDASVRVWVDQETLVVQIEDRGVGFDSQTALAAGASSGLSGMRERASLLGGRIAIQSRTGEGTQLTAELPLGAPVVRSVSQEIA